MMQCIFCKKDSGSSKSVEHIIPESLGNTDHTLPPGVVCDGCNQYFSLKIEKPLLDSNWFVHTRHRNRVPSKKGRIPPIQGLHMQTAVPVEFGVDKEGHGNIGAATDKDSSLFIKSIQSSERITVVVPIPTPPDEYVLSRFLGKVAIEALARKLLNVADGLTEVVEKKELDELRDYVRWGKGKAVWPYHERVLYPEDLLFYEEEYGHYELLHEFAFLYTKRNELYLVLVVFGVEYVINLGGPDLSGYLEWLNENQNKSYINMCEPNE